MVNIQGSRNAALSSQLNRTRSNRFADYSNRPGPMPECLHPPGPFPRQRPQPPLSQATISQFLTTLQNIMQQLFTGLQQLLTGGNPPNTPPQDSDSADPPTGGAGTTSDDDTDPAPSTTNPFAIGATLRTNTPTEEASGTDTQNTGNQGMDLNAILQQLNMES